MSVTLQNNAAAPTPQDGTGKIIELKVSGHLMALDPGIFCLSLQSGAAPPPRDGSGLPGVRISLPPAADGRVTIRGLRDDGWLGVQDAAALVQITGGPAQILVTVYQLPAHPSDTAPHLQVLRLDPPAAPTAAPPPPEPLQATELIAHIQRTGNVGARFGEWLGTPGSKHWIEGFAVSGRPDLAAEDFEYQAVLGRDWVSPWMSGQKFCGSRGMALPMLGFTLRLRGLAAEKFACRYRASFIDGTTIGPLESGQPCAAASLAPLEAFQIELLPRAAATPARKPA